MLVRSIDALGAWLLSSLEHAFHIRRFPQISMSPLTDLILIHRCIDQYITQKQLLR